MQFAVQSGDPTSRISFNKTLNSQLIKPGQSAGSLIDKTQVRLLSDYRARENAAA
ncbi:hypothetical protein BOSE46_120345 [Bosea sp. 46]|nr:hypothetical protein BOSE46_120345 [Bosea sp. 46]CAD5278984.1 hypothetical protein BOSE7B_40646 [Bosea sp. 7B]VXC82226.1 hypothetical protein BOSE127_60044 [Bosea sp. 127]